MYRPMLALAALLTAAGAANAQMQFTATLRGTNEVPANASPGQGSGTFTLNAAQTELTFNVTYSNLTAGNTLLSAHFHNEAAGVNGPVVRGMAFPGADGPGGHPAGSFTGTWRSTDAQPLTPTLVTQLLQQRIYFNIHTTPSFTGGEIRGQLVPVPEPSTFLLGGVGLAGLAAYRRRRAATAAAEPAA